VDLWHATVTSEVDSLCVHGSTGRWRGGFSGYSSNSLLWYHRPHCYNAATTVDYQC